MYLSPTFSQIVEGMTKGRFNLTFKQRLAGWFNKDSIKQVKHLLDNLSKARTYLERANLCAECMGKPELKDSLSLHLVDPMHNSINLHFDYKGKSRVIQKDFINPTNDDNQGFTFAKKKHLILICGSKGSINYTDSMPALARGDLQNVNFKLTNGDTITLDNIIKHKKLEQEWNLADGYLLSCQNNFGIINIKIYNNPQKLTTSLCEHLTLIEHTNERYIIQTQSQVGPFIPNYFIFESLAFSYQDVQDFLCTQQSKISEYWQHQKPKTNENLKLQEVIKFNGATHKIIISPTTKDQTVHVYILPPKYLERKSTTKTAHKITKKFDTPQELSEFVAELKDKKYKIITKNSRQCTYLVPQTTEILKHRIYPLLTGSTRVYKYGGAQFEYNFLTGYLTNVQELICKKSKAKLPNDRIDEQTANDVKTKNLKILSFRDKRYFIGPHYRGITLADYLRLNDLLPKQDDELPRQKVKFPKPLKFKFIQLVKELINHDLIIEDFHHRNIIIDKDLNLKVCDGTMHVNYSNIDVSSPRF